MPIEYRAVWNGSGMQGTGYSVFHGRTDGVATTSQAAQDLADRVRKLFLDLSAQIVPSIAISFPPEALELDTTTGDLLDVIPVTSPADVVTTGASAAHSRASGARIDWSTSAVVSGRRLRGRTFVVPLVGGGYSTTGGISAGNITTIETAAGNYMNTSVFTRCHPVVWSRTHGIAADITGRNVPAKVTVLRSRRD